jgi:Pyridoxamine 5'-phosphate oxidase
MALSDLSEHDLEFLTDNPSAAMITIGSDGLPKATRVGVGIVDGRLWSSGTADRVRTKRLRDDPRCTLYVHDPRFSFMTLETTVTILDGPDVPADSLRFFRQLQGKPEGPLSWFEGELDDEAFLQTMVDEQRILYDFDVQRVYGLR